MCLPHLHWIFTVFSTRFVVGLGLLGQAGPGKESARTHDVSAAPPLDLHRLFNKVCRGAWDCWVRRGRERRVRGHMMCLPHLHWIFTVFSTRFVVVPGIVGSGGARKGECEDT